MNAKARSLSIEESKSVKDVFKQLHLDGKDLSEWWTLFVRDSDLGEFIHSLTPLLPHSLTHSLSI